MELATIKTFDNSMDAHILKATLEGNGISCYLFDDNIMSVNPLLNISIGGIKLKVALEDESRAIELINEIESHPYTDDSDHVIRCPKCNSTDIISGHRSTKGIWSIISGIISLWLRIFPLYANYVYKCRNCGTEFKLNSKRLGHDN